MIEGFNNFMFQLNLNNVEGEREQEQHESVRLFPCSSAGLSVDIFTTCMKY